MTRLVTLLAVTVGLAATGCGAAGDSSPGEVPRPDVSRSSSTVALAVERAGRDVERSPGSAEAWGRLGNLYLAHGWGAEAAAAYRRASELEPDDFRWPYLLGRSLMQEDPEAAARALEGAVELGTDYPPVYAEHARVLRKLGRLEEAAGQLERLSELVPDNPHTHLGLGEIALADQRYEEARDHLLRALELHPGQSEAHRALAQVYVALDEPGAAERHAQRGREPSRFEPLEDPLWDAVERAGNTRRWYAYRGRRLLRQGRYEEAAEEMERALAEDEETPMLRHNLGVALIGAKRYDEATRVLELAAQEARQGDPGELATIHTTLSAAYSGSGDLAAAERSVRLALELDPASVEATAGLALVLARDGRTGEAIDVLRNSPLEDPRLTRLLAGLRRRAAEAP